MIRAAPWSFCLVCIVAFTICLVGFRTYYGQKLSDSDGRAQNWKNDADYWKDIANRPSRMVVSNPPPVQSPCPAAESLHKPSKMKLEFGTKPVNTSDIPPVPIASPQNVSAPNGIAIGGGRVSNPTVNNFGPPPANLSYTEEVITPLPRSGEGFKVMKVHVTTDRSIRGAVIGIVFSDHVDLIVADKDKPELKGAAITQINWGEGLKQGDITVPNSWGFVINLPSVFMAGQELIVTVKSKNDARVIQLGAIQ